MNWETLRVVIVVTALFVMASDIGKEDVRGAAYQDELASAFHDRPYVCILQGTNSPRFDAPVSIEKVDCRVTYLPIEGYRYERMVRP